MPEPVVLPARFNGPPDSANGGYACGAAAALLDGPAEVTLRSPPPLDVPLRPEHGDDGLSLFDGETLVAEVRPGEVAVEPPTPIDPAAASAAAEGYRGFEGHWFPTCFVCGPDRAPGDGLRIFPGPVDDGGLAAAPWRPDPSLADAEGHVRPEIVWAALDCPAFFGGVPEGVGGVLGRMAAELRAPVPAGADVVAMGWGLGREGRKRYCASALTSGDGEVLAVARATWIELSAPPT